ncbi:MAG TPA: acyl carrier protein [Candidatus Eisenbacteria bacterium]|nr:acyl carrier protein [Candidatus Eisenbacteria bacterium]
MAADLQTIVRSLIAKHFDLAEGEVDFAMRIEDAGDSLKLSELVIALEQRLGIRLPDSALARVRTLGDLWELVQSKVGPSGT